MTASANIKTPQMEILVCVGEEEKAKAIARNLNKVTLMQVSSLIHLHIVCSRKCIFCNFL